MAASAAGLWAGCGGGPSDPALPYPTLLGTQGPSRTTCGPRRATTAASVARLCAGCGRVHNDPALPYPSLFGTQGPSRTTCGPRHATTAASSARLCAACGGGPTVPCPAVPYSIGTRPTTSTDPKLQPCRQRNPSLSPLLSCTRCLSCSTVCCEAVCWWMLCSPAP